MSFRKPQDEWSVIIQKQAEFNKLREQEERARQAQEKGDLRRDLEFQKQLQDIQRRQEQEARDREGSEVIRRAQLFREQDSAKRVQDTVIKKQMAEDLMNHHSFLKQKEQQERQRKYEEEQAHLRRVQAQLEEEERRKKEQRDRLSIEQQMMKQYRDQQEDLKRQQAMSEKMYEVDLQRQRKEKEEKKEQEYRDYYQRLSEDQMNKGARFSQSVNTQITQKNIEITDWINKNVQEHQQFLAKKEEYERQLRDANLRSVNDTLRFQAEEKERQRYMALEEARRNAEEVSRKIEETKLLEQERENQRRMQQQMYREQLSIQAQISNDVRMNAFKLSEHEKLMNRNVLDAETSPSRSRFQRGANEILKSSSIYDPKSLGISYEDNSRNLIGDQQSPVGYNRSSPYLTNRKPEVSRNPITGNGITAGIKPFANLNIR